MCQSVIMVIASPACRWLKAIYICLFAFQWKRKSSVRLGGLLPQPLIQGVSEKFSFFPNPSLAFFIHIRDSSTYCLNLLINLINRWQSTVDEAGVGMGKKKIFFVYPVSWKRDTQWLIFCSLYLCYLRDRVRRVWSSVPGVEMRDNLLRNRFRLKFRDENQERTQKDPKEKGWQK